MPSDPRHPHVLVVDDDGDTRELYSIMLSAVGYRVETAATVRAAAAAMAGRDTPQVVMTDWRLPDGDGFAVADALHAHAASRAVPIVAVTGVSMTPEMETQARARGFTAVLLKPAAPDDILTTVRLAGEIATSRQVRVAAQRLRRYAARASWRAVEMRAANHAIDTGALLARAAARSGENITLTLADDAARYVAAAGDARKLTGYEPQELLSLTVWDLTPPPDASTGEGCWRSFIASGTREGRYTLRRRDGGAVEAQYCQIANVVPGLHVSAIAPAIQMPTSF